MLVTKIITVTDSKGKERKLTIREFTVGEYEAIHADGKTAVDVVKANLSQQDQAILPDLGMRQIPVIRDAIWDLCYGSGETAQGN